MQQATLTPALSPTVSLVNGRPATTSLEVAKFFGKRHDNVVRDIRNVIANSPESFHDLNFEEMSHSVEIGNGALRDEVFFTLHRDGFMLLVMGYTGKKAMQIKIAYIDAFNAMETELTKRLAPRRGRKPAQKELPEGLASSPALVPPTPRSTYEDIEKRIAALRERMASDRKYAQEEQTKISIELLNQFVTFTYSKPFYHDIICSTLHTAIDHLLETTLKYGEWPGSSHNPIRFVREIKTFMGA